MDTTSNTLEELFHQLGLEADEASITTFVQQHKITEEIPLHKAAFWSVAQAQFIRESWCEDSDWVVVIDQLNTLLRQ